MGRAAILGLIPARGGSKGVPMKNIRPLLGKPLILYTIEEASRSKYLTHLVTSTDSEEIARIAREAGSEVIMRPAELAQDDTPTLPVVRHAILYLENHRNIVIDYVVLLQPTAPLRTAGDIDNAIEKLINTGADSVTSVCRVSDAHPMKMKKIVDDRIIPYYEEEPEGIRRQDLPPAYLRNGAVYATTRKNVIENNSLIGKDSHPYLMPPEQSANINDEIDFKLAEILLKGQRKRGKS